MLRIYKFCWPYIKPEKWRVLLYTLLYLILSGTALLSTYVTGEFIDVLEASTETGFILRFALIFAGIALINVVARFMMNHTHSMLEANCCHNMQEAAIHSVQKTSLRFAQEQNTTQLSYKINQYVCMTIIFCFSNIGQLISNGLKFLFPLGFLLFIRPSLGFILLGIVATDAVCYKLLKKSTYKVEKIFREAQAKYFSLLKSQLSDVKFIQMQSIADSLITRFRAGRDELRKKMLKWIFVDTEYSAIKIVLNAVATIAALFIGGVAVVNKEITLGQFTVILSYLATAIGSIEFFFSLGKTVQGNRVYCDKLEEIFFQKPQTNGAKAVEDIEKVECRGLDFGYGEKPVLKDRNVTFEKGKIYALAGENGSGKSTLLSLLLGLYIDEYQGEVAYDGVSIRELDMEQLRRRSVGVSEQEPMLLPETLRFNLTLEDSRDIDQAEFQHLCDILGLNEFLKGLPEGLDTVIQENTGNLSGGEKQKLSIMRALLKHPKLLVLDEPTSALDKASRESFSHYLQEIKTDKIILLSTHDKELLSICDEIVTVEKLVAE